MDVWDEGVFAKHCEEHAVPLRVRVGGLVEDNGDHSLDVDEGGGLC